jgi:hypothetical protein
MDALNEVLQFLDRHTGFTQELDDLVQSPQWPTGWLSAYQIAQEVERFQFWSGVRNRVPRETRVRLIDYYLKRTADDNGSGWVRIDDQYKFNPDAADIDNGKAVDGKANQRRRHGRITCEMLACQFGEVVNLSASGVMVQGKGQPQHKLDDRIALDLKCLDHDLHATARVAWVKENERAYDMGMEFVDLTADQAQRIRELLPIAAAVQSIGDSGQVTHYGR